MGAKQVFSNSCAAVVLVGVCVNVWIRERTEKATEEATAAAEFKQKQVLLTYRN